MGDAPVFDRTKVGLPRRSAQRGRHSAHQSVVGKGMGVFQVFVLPGTGIPDTKKARDAHKQGYT